MKRLLTVLLAAIALPVFGAGGWTILGNRVSCWMGIDPTLTNYQHGLLYTNDVAMNVFDAGAIPILAKITNSPADFTPERVGEQQYWLNVLRSTNATDWGRIGWTHVASTEYIDTNTPAALPVYYTIAYAGGSDAPGTTDWNDALPNGGEGTALAYYNTNCFGCQTVNTNSGTLLWSKVGQNIQINTVINHIAVDGSSNTYAVGYFTGVTDFGFGQSNSFPNSSTGNALLVKYNASGSVVWLKLLAATNTPTGGNVVGRGIAVDHDGNVIITGGFGGGLDFSGVGTAGATLISQGNANIFVAKYQPDGTYIWAKRLGGSYSDNGYSVSVNSINDVYIGGSLTSLNADFGGVTISCPGIQGIFVAKLSGTDGTTLWAKGVGGSAYNQLQGLEVDSSGNCFVTGFFTSGSSSLGADTLTNAGSADVFLGKLASGTGNCLWSRRFGGTGGDSGVALAVDPNTDNIILAGGFHGTVDFGGGMLDTYNNGGIVMAGYGGTTGNYLWAIKTGGGDDTGLGVAADSSGNLLLASKAVNAVNFGVWPQNLWLVGNGRVNLIVAAFTLSGTNIPTYRWSKDVGIIPDGISAPTGAAIDSGKYFIVGGTFQGGVDFGGIIVYNVAPGYSASFVNKYIR